MKTAVLSIAAIAVPAASGLSVTVFGGTGYVGSAVCERLVKKGHTVTAVSRRGQNPKPNSAELSQVGPSFHRSTAIERLSIVQIKMDREVHIALGRREVGRGESSALLRFLQAGFPNE